jgi:glycine/D-amino acid oxidase-like deaminating enzyme
MHVIVLGAGVTGLTTAHCLAGDGHRVTVVDRAQGPGLSASFANGGQLSYNYVAPLAAPSALMRSISPGWRCCCGKRGKLSLPCPTICRSNPGAGCDPPP